MRFVPAYFELEAPAVDATIYYTQKVESETDLKNVKKKQKLIRNLKVEINPTESQSTIVAITIQKEILKLDSILKKQENISNEISKTIDFVQLRINPLGEPISILNHNQIVEKWYPIRKKLERDFKGKAIEDYLGGIEMKLKNHDALLNDFKQYRLFGGFFSQLYFEHSSEVSKQNERDQKIDNFIFGKSVVFKERILLDKVKEKEKNITLRINADIDFEKNDLEAIKDEFKKREITEDSDLGLKNYVGSYLIDKKSSLVKSMNLQIYSTYGSDFQKKINYSLTQDVK